MAIRELRTQSDIDAEVRHRQPRASKRATADEALARQVLIGGHALRVDVTVRGPLVGWRANRRSRQLVHAAAALGLVARIDEARPPSWVELDLAPGESAH